MIEFGATLRAAREAKGITPAQLAQSTHLMIQQIEALEREDFSKIAAPIYGRGFVRLYCEAVGLDPQPLIAEFMAIFTGNRQPTIRTRAPLPPPQSQPPPDDLPPLEALPPLGDLPPVEALPPVADEPVPAPPAEAAPVDLQLPEAPLEEPPVTEELPPLEEPLVAPPPVSPSADFRLESDFVPPPKPSAELRTAPAPDPYADSLFPPDELDPPPPTRRGPSRFAAPLPIDEDDGSFRFSFAHLQIPRAVWRIGTLAVVGILIIWLLYACLHALYRATMGGKDGESSEAAPTAESSAAATKMPSDSAPQVPLKPLYID